MLFCHVEFILTEHTGDDQDVNLFSERVQERAVPGLPQFNPNRVVGISI